ncbi:MAG: PH domain-containing protein [Myxococcales bacterium]|nr:PH domain-containing protein [Myxococcales bacterium]
MPNTALTPTPPPDPQTEDVLFEGSPAVVPSVGLLLVAILTLGLALPVLWLRARGKRYKITNQRIVIELGLFSKTMEQVDLYRITDYVVERPFGQRIMGTGNLLLEAIDSTSPMVRLAGLKTDVVLLYEKIRTATEAAKQRRGVRVVDYGEPGVPIS